jgi:hypothetical protein
MKLILLKTDVLDDWYVIERAEHDGRVWSEPVPGRPDVAVLRSSARFSDADVEGTAEEMRAIARAIRERQQVSFRRCAVDARIADAGRSGRPVYEALAAAVTRVRFWSPRNSQTPGSTTFEEALELAVQIEKELGSG